MPLDLTVVPDVHGVAFGLPAEVGVKESDARSLHHEPVAGGVALVGPFCRKPGDVSVVWRMGGPSAWQPSLRGQVKGREPVMAAKETIGITL